MPCFIASAKFRSVRRALGNPTFMRKCPIFSHSVSPNRSKTVSLKTWSRSLFAVSEGPAGQLTMMRREIENCDHT